MWKRDDKKNLNNEMLVPFKHPYLGLKCSNLILFLNNSTKMLISIFQRETTPQ